MRILVILFCLFLCGCSQPERGKTPCQMNARQRGQYYTKMGIPVRYGHGVIRFQGMESNKKYNKSINGIRHMWCEFYDKKQGVWLLAHDTIKGYHGWPIKSYGDTYEVLWYGYPEKEIL